MSLHERLVVFIKEKIEESDKVLNDELTAHTSLIKSGLFDSLALLELATWIEGEVGAEMDLAAFDLAQEWETIPDIVRFIEKCRGSR